jgi:hypothetical protein
VGSRGEVAGSALFVRRLLGERRLSLLEDITAGSVVPLWVSEKFGR